MQEDLEVSANAAVQDDLESFSRWRVSTSIVSGVEQNDDFCETDVMMHGWLRKRSSYQTDCTIAVGSASDRWCR